MSGVAGLAAASARPAEEQGAPEHCGYVLVYPLYILVQIQFSSLPTQWFQTLLEQIHFLVKLTRTGSVVYNSKC